MRLALRLIVEVALEGEAADALGRERYEHGEDPKPGYRTAIDRARRRRRSGAADYSARQLRDAARRAIRVECAGGAFGRTRELERLAVELNGVACEPRLRTVYRRAQAASVAGGVSEIGEDCGPSTKTSASRSLRAAIAYLFVAGSLSVCRTSWRRSCSPVGATF